MLKCKCVFPITSFVFLAALFGSLLPAQTFTGSIAGHVTDSSGLPVGGVEIVAVATATNDTFKAATNSAGDYTIGFLKPCIYRVTFTATGFKESVQNGVQMDVNQAVRLDQELQVGQRSDTVEVTAAGSQVNYESPEIAHTVGAEQMQNVPEVTSSSRGRSPFLLSKLLPGVVSTSSNNSNINNFSFGGGRPTTNEILIDGLPTTNPSDNTYTFTPSPDSVDEFKVVTSPFSAEFGHTGGGVLMATTKQGTNEYHGVLYEYFRNRILNARSFFQASNDQRYLQNDPGFNVGGPVILPGYDGRNKTFFFAAWNETFAVTPAPALESVPSTIERTGDFSQTNGNTVSIYDPATTNVDASGNIIRSPFPNNTIPTSRLDPVAGRIITYYPIPNGSFQGGTYNYQVNASSRNEIMQGVLRFDHNVGDYNKFFSISDTGLRRSQNQ